MEGSLQGRSYVDWIMDLAMHLKNSHVFVPVFLHHFLLYLCMYFVDEPWLLQHLLDKVLFLIMYTSRSFCFIYIDFFCS